MNLPITVRLKKHYFTRKHSNKDGKNNLIINLTSKTITHNRTYKSSKKLVPKKNSFVQNRITTFDFSPTKTKNNEMAVCMTNRHNSIVTEKRAVPSIAYYNQTLYWPVLITIFRRYLHIMVTNESSDIGNFRFSTAE